MDRRFQESGIEVSVKVWLVCGALFGVVLGMSALDEGSSALSLIVAPILVGLGAAAVAIIDRWVTHGKS
jgi:F0F1-type ATP synthase assembly protein I